MSQKGELARQGWPVAAEAGVCALSLASVCMSVATGDARGHRQTPPAAAPTPPTVKQFMLWMRSTEDNEGMPFAVIDKTRAHLWLFDAHGRALGSTPVLLGRARGDASVPGIGERPMAQILPHERTTPAGRFVLEPGLNATGEDVFWVDYHAAVSLHCVRTTLPAERRLQRLATASAADNRISYGCINVPRDFYNQALRPSFQTQRGVLYLLPETLPLSALFTPVPRETVTALKR